MATAKKFKLGPLASSFYDASTGLKIIGKNVVEPTARQLRSAKFKEARLNTFIVEATAEDEDDDSEDLGFDQDTATKDQLIAEILKIDGVEETEAELKKMKKPELVDLYDEYMAEEEGE